MTSTRSLDLAAESIQEAELWKNALHTLLILLSSNTDWAIENLNRTKPTWRHDSLDNPPPSSRRRKGSMSSRDSNDQYDEIDKQAELAYQKASQKSRTDSNITLKDQMFIACKAGDIDTLSSILKTKISVNLMSGELKDTPLMIACRYGMDDIARLCLNYGARNDPHPDFGQTALHCAVESKSFGCVRILLDAAAPSGSDSLISNLKDTNGNSSLHLASRIGDIRICKLLVSHGADISLRDSNFRTVLHISSYYGHKNILSYLLDSGGDGYLELIDSDGRTALHYAAECGHISCVKLLLQSAANPLAIDSNKQSPYHLASRNGHKQICELLLEYQRNTPDGYRIHQSQLYQQNIPSLPLSLPLSSRNNGWINDNNLMKDPMRVSTPPIWPQSIPIQQQQQQFNYTLAPPSLTRNSSFPISSTSSPVIFENNLSLPRPHTSRPSSAVATTTPTPTSIQNNNNSNNTPNGINYLSPARQSKEKFKFDSINNNMPSPREQEISSPR